MPSRSVALPEQMKETIAAYLAANGEAFELLHEGAGFKLSRYPVDISKGFRSDLAHLSHVRKGARMLGLEAILEAENDRPASATKSLLALLGLARSLANEPLLVSQLVRFACDGTGLHTLNQILSRTAFNEDQLVQLQTAFRNAEDASSLMRAFAGERYLIIDAFGQLQSGKMKPEEMAFLTGDPTLEPVEFSQYKVDGRLDEDYLAFLEITEGYLRALAQPYPKRLEDAKTMEDRAATLPKGWFYTRLLVPSLYKPVLGHDAKHVGSLHVAIVALAVERWRLAHGTLPDKLDEPFLHALPADPFDGQPLRYKRLDKGYVVYSTGEDGVDDGGDEKKDITFRVER